MRSRMVFMAVALWCAVLLAASAAFAASWGRVFTVPRTISVRESPFDDALQVRMLKSGQRVRADFFEDGWAAVFDLRETQRSELKAMGYVRVSDLTGGRVMDIEERGEAPERKASKRTAAKDEEEPVAVKAKSVRRSKQAKAGEDEEAAAPAEKRAVKKGGKTEAVEERAEHKPVKTAKNSRKSRHESKEAKEPKGFGEILVADRPLSVRADRNIDSTLKRVLRAGQKVRVDFAQGGWSAVFDPAVTTRDESLAWGYAASKFLVSESEYQARQSGQAAPDKETAEPAAKTRKDAEPAKTAKGGKTAAKDSKKKDEPVEEAIGYKVLEHKADRKSKATVLRVRLTVSRPPANDAMRTIAREIWKSERRKGEVIQLEVLLSRMDPKGLAYAVVKFRADGRINEFWWRDTVLEDSGK